MRKRFLMGDLLVKGDEGLKSVLGVLDDLGTLFPCPLFSQKSFLKKHIRILIPHLGRNQRRI